jgi:uncharacterized protein YbcI
MTSPDHQELDAGACAAAISTAIAQLLRDYSGRGPTRAQTTIGNDLIVCMLADTLSKGEWKLVERGEERVVLKQRDAVHRIMRDDAVAAVERLSGRTVTAFMSHNNIDPDCAVEMFLLAPVSRAQRYWHDGGAQAAHRRAGDPRHYKADATREPGQSLDPGGRAQPEA